MTRWAGRPSTTHWLGLRGLKIRKLCPDTNLGYHSDLPVGKECPGNTATSPQAPRMTVVLNSSGSGPADEKQEQTLGVSYRLSAILPGAALTSRSIREDTSGTSSTQPEAGHPGSALDKRATLSKKLT